MKYIGDFDKLMDYGYRLVDDTDVIAVKKIENRNVFIDRERKVLSWRDEDIADLIKDGLLE